MRTRPSPVFLGLLALWVFGGWAAWTEAFNPRVAVFLFVFVGWIVSLCLHEFGHARAALWGGDESVVGRGYLTLNPLRYVHPGLSMLLPLVFLLAGGIGLPGGAVYIHTSSIRSRGRRTVMSLAGPGMNLLLGIIFALSFRFSSSAMEQHPYFGSALAFLTVLQFMAGVFNLLPVPGLDGFGALEPWIPTATLTAIEPYRAYGPGLLFLLVFRSTAFNRQIFGRAFRLADTFGADLGFARIGSVLFKFWQRDFSG